MGPLFGEQGSTEFLELEESKGHPPKGHCKEMKIQISYENSSNIPVKFQWNSSKIEAKL